MDGVERHRSLKERLGLNGMACCGPNWGFGPSTTSVLGEEESPLTDPISENESSLTEPINRGSSLTEPMSLAMALAAERLYLAAQESEHRASPMGPLRRPNSGPIGEAARTSLMMLLHETDGEDLERESDEKLAGMGSDTVCCVCMVRKKGAAFIPCGHTFCRVCSRELWMNRGSCPLCNRRIVQILDIF